jgi:hypothetical protein
MNYEGFDVRLQDTAVNLGAITVTFVRAAVLDMMGRLALVLLWNNVQVGLAINVFA